MWLLLFVPIIIGPYQPEPVAPFATRYDCMQYAHKFNHTQEAMKRQSWGEFQCWHATNTLLRITMCND